jgi:predicted GNAT superfamily acetyltransferase
MDGTPADPAVTHASTVVQVPEDYHALREKDPAEARRRRDQVADELAAAFEGGFEATGFLREGAYVLERA